MGERAAAVRPAPDGAGAWIRVKVVPGASRTEIAGTWDDRLRVRVAAPPEGGRANRALLEVLADRLGVPASRLRVVRGHASAQKTVAVDGLDPADIDLS